MYLLTYLVPCTSSRRRCVRSAEGRTASEERQARQWCEINLLSSWLVSAYCHHTVTTSQERVTRMSQVCIIWKLWCYTLLLMQPVIWQCCRCWSAAACSAGKALTRLCCSIYRYSQGFPHAGHQTTVGWSIYAAPNHLLATERLSWSQLVSGQLVTQWTHHSYLIIYSTHHGQLIRQRLKSNKRTRPSMME